MVNKPIRSLPAFDFFIKFFVSNELSRINKILLQLSMSTTFKRKSLDRNEEIFINKTKFSGNRLDYTLDITSDKHVSRLKQSCHHGHPFCSVMGK